MASDAIDRTGAAALIPEEAANVIIKDAAKASAALSLFNTTTMSRKQDRLPALSAFPTAYFRDGDTGLATPSTAAWTNKYLNAEAIDVVVPIPNVVLDDAEFNVWDEITPLCSEAVGRTLDGAIFFGTNIPSAWGDALNHLAADAGNVITYGTASQATGGLAKDISDLMALIEADGYDVTGFVGPRRIKGAFRGLRDSTGQKLLDVTSVAGEYSVEGLPVFVGMDGMWSAATTGTAGAAQLFAGDWSKQLIGVRKDISYRVVTEGVISDASGAILYNLPQQDMSALYLTCRFAWVMANPITRSNSTDPCAVGMLRTAP